MGNKVSTKESSHPPKLRGQHECEILGRGPEAAESEAQWNSCKKNPGHEQFIPVRKFLRGRWAHSLSDRQYEELGRVVNRAVRIRVQWTSTVRPDDDYYSELRGKDWLRVGTGYVYGVSELFNKACPCSECDGKVVMKHWKFSVLTARHVVYNTEEANSAKIDLFYDDESCRLDGSMKTLKVVDASWTDPYRDTNTVWCVTHDEDLVRRIESGSLVNYDALDFSLSRRVLPYWSKVVGREKPGLPVLIVSHPHGQPKMITVGKVTATHGMFREYNAATCSGSSGAAILYNRPATFLHKAVHSGTDKHRTSRSQYQVNYGHVHYAL